MILIGIITWQVMVAMLIIFDPHPYTDMKRCSKPDANFVRHCFPKDGCFMNDKDVLCWRVVKVKKGKV